MMDIDRKINRVIASCKTKEQIICACRFMILAAERRKIVVTRARYWQGVVDGICHVNKWK